MAEVSINPLVRRGVRLFALVSALVTHYNIVDVVLCQGAPETAFALVSALGTLRSVTGADTLS